MARLPRFLAAALVPGALVLSAAALTPHAAAAQLANAPLPSPVDSTLLHSFKWRNLGPERGGRSIAVSGVKGQPKVAYFGATGGGLWKTTNGGDHWAPVTDGQIRSASIGAVAVSEKDPNEVFIGTGECEIRGDVMPGDGMYRSTDAGKTWSHVGFENTDAICKVRVDPTNPRVVFAAVFGKYAAPSSERGVYRSTDGGVTWKRVLFRNDSTGAIDVQIDRKNPQVIYAALWQAFRKEYTASSGGAGSGLFKSTDGGTTWTEITRNAGLPVGIDGKIGVAVSPANANRVYALVENAKGGLYSSDDAGATWKLVNESHDIRQRAFYYTHVYADPTDENVIYMQNTSLFKSTDGGKKLTTLRGTHGDFHDLWIDPDDGKHLVVANDGGGAVSTDGGKKWTDQNFSTAQLYHVAATVAYPYDLCGAQQDASTICVSSTANAMRGGRGFGGGGGNASATYSAGGAEPGYIAPDPLDPNIFFAGSNNGGFLTRLNRTTGEYREVSPYPLMFSGEPSSELVERWQWTYPIIFSPIDPHLLYASSQHLWKTTNNGQSWTRISPDLTRHDPSTMGASGGPITHDMNAPEVYGTVFAIGPSKLDTNVIWTGSDDGLIYVTRDDGANWSNVTPKDIPGFGRVSQIDASAFDGGAAYVAVKRPLLDDPAPYIYRTHDYGRTWTKIVNGLRSDDYVHAVREDPSRKGLLFAATQHGVYMSYDDGDHWSSLSLKLPDVPVSDLIVYRHDIAISTHGRGFYLLENIVPLEQYSSVVQSASDAYFFAPAPATRSTDGATISYWLKHPAKSVALDILDASGKVIRTYASDTSTTKATPAADSDETPPFGRAPAAPSKAAGLDHFTWNLRYQSATSFPGMILWGGSTDGPAALPGSYTIRLVVDGHTFSQPIQVKPNPLFTDVTDADMEAQFALATRIRDVLSSADQAVIDIRTVRSRTDTLLKRNNDTVLKQLGDKLNADAAVVEENIYQVQNQSGQDPLNFPIKINNRIASLLSAVNRGDGKPIDSAPVIFDYLTAKLKVQTDALAGVWATDLAAFNARATSLKLAPVKP